MKNAWIRAIAVIETVVLGNVARGGLSLEEDLSLYFSEIAITNGDSLALTVDGMNENVIHVRIGDLGRFRVAETGRTFVVKKCEPFWFHHSRSPCARLSLMDVTSLTNEQVRVPPQYEHDESILVLNDGQGTKLLSVGKGTAYSCKTKTFESFQFPFRRVWRDKQEFSLWCAGLPYRHRIDEIRRMVKTESDLAEDCFRILTKELNLNERTVHEGRGLSHMKIALCDGLGTGRFSYVRNVSVQIDDTGKEQAIVGLGIEPCSTNGTAYRYRFDSIGRLRWFYSVNVGQKNSGEKNTDGHRIFELDDCGRIRRAFSQGELPLLIVSDRTYFFTGDGELLRQFFSDFGVAMGEGKN